MKRTSIFAVLVTLVTPVFADTSSMQEKKLLPAETVEANAPTAVIETETTNPDIKFPHGLQLGVGVSATSGLNGFVGYANKNFDSFWLKRLGLRLNFATTAPLKSAIDSGVDEVCALALG